MNYTKSIVERLPDSVYEQLDSARLMIFVSGDALLVKNSVGSTISTPFEIMFDGALFYCWPSSTHVCCNADCMIAVGVLLEEMCKLSMGDFIDGEWHMTSSHINYT